MLVYEKKCGHKGIPNGCDMAANLIFIAVFGFIPQTDITPDGIRRAHSIYLPITISGLIATITAYICYSISPNLPRSTD